MNRNWIVRVFTFILAAVLVLPSAAFASPRLVEKGDAITFAKSALSDPNNVVKIEWQQNLKNRSQDYVETAANYTVDGQNSSAPLFVQKNFVDKLLGQCGGESADICTLKVSSEFQYGQDNDKTSQFLVYHDQGNKAYQHRFVSSETASKFANSAQKLVESLGKPVGEIVPQVKIATAAFNKIVSLGKAYIGDYLRNF